MPAQDLALEIDKALAAHAAWRQKLTTAIRTGQINASPHDIARDDKCAFGLWLHGPSLDKATKQRKPYQVTRRLHAEFHEVAGQVARLVEDGKCGEAVKLLDNEYATRSETLTRALKIWRDQLAR